MKKFGNILIAYLLEGAGSWVLGKKGIGLALVVSGAIYSPWSECASVVTGGPLLKLTPFEVRPLQATVAWRSTVSEFPTVLDG